MAGSDAVPRWPVLALSQAGWNAAVFLCAASWKLSVASDAPVDLVSRLNRVTQERDYFMAETARQKAEVSRGNIRIAELESMIARMREQER